MTDSPRLLRRNFGELHQTSPTLTAAHRGEATDVLDKGWRRYATHVTYGGGVRDVTASSSAADEEAIPQARKPEATPYAALDGDRFTAWETGGWDGPSGQWLRVDFDKPRDVRDLTAVFVQNGLLGPPVTRVAVQTENGTVEQDVQKIATAQPLRAPDGPTRWLRLRITALASTPAVPAFTRAGVAELSIGGVRSTRTYTMPAPAGADGPATYVMSRPPGAASECVKGSRRWVCSPSLGSGDEEGTGFDRTFTSPTAAKAPVTGMAVLTDQRLIARYAAVHGQPVVSASSTLSEHPADQPRSGFDGDQATAWIAGEKENAPAYSVRWKGRKRLSSVTVTRPPARRGRSASGWRAATARSAKGCRTPRAAVVRPDHHRPAEAHLLQGQPHPADPDRRDRRPGRETVPGRAHLPAPASVRVRPEAADRRRGRPDEGDRNPR
ncbi:discoidin domain-containing protein [Actinomadura madurae]|nr:discoidin domain-containing protein [Actinomadura madurae]